MKHFKYLTAIPLAIAALAGCSDGQNESQSSLHDATLPAPAPQAFVAESTRCSVAEIPSWTFYDYCSCVETMSPDAIDEELGEGASESMKRLKKALAPKADKVLATSIFSTSYKGQVCKATGLLFERKTVILRKNVETELGQDSVALNRRLPLAQSSITSPLPIVYLSKLGSNVTGQVVAVDLSYNNLSDEFFRPLRSIDWLKTLGINELDLSNNVLESTLAIDIAQPTAGSPTSWTLTSIDLAANKIKLFEAWPVGVTINGLSYLSLADNNEFKAFGLDSNNVAQSLGSALTTRGDKTELFLDLSNTATDSLQFDGNKRPYSGLNLDGLKFKDDATVGIIMPNYPSWFTARNTKNLGRVIAVNSSTAAGQAGATIAYLNVDGAKGLGNLNFLVDRANRFTPKVAYLSAVGSDFSSFGTSRLDLAAIEFFSVDGSSVSSLNETFSNLLYASSTGVADAQYLDTAAALQGAVVDASVQCPPTAAATCKTASNNGLGRLPEAGVETYVENFCKTNFAGQGCSEAVRTIIGGNVTDAELSQKADEYVQNWCQSVFDKPCDLAANVASPVSSN